VQIIDIAVCRQGRVRREEEDQWIEKFIDYSPSW